MIWKTLNSIFFIFALLGATFLITGNNLHEQETLRVLEVLGSAMGLLYLSDFFFKELNIKKRKLGKKDKEEVKE